MGQSSSGQWRRPRVATRLSVLVLVGVVAACGGGGSESPVPTEAPPADLPGPSPAQGFAIFPARLSLNVDDEGVLLPQAAPTPALVWSSSDPAVATVDTTGRLKALSRGSAIISAAGAGAIASTALTVYRSTGAGADASSESLIAQALAAGRIDPEQALTYRVFAMFGDERLPAEFAGAPSAWPNHLLLREVSGRLPGLSPSTQGLLTPYLIAPIYAESRHARKLARQAAPVARERLRSDVTVNCFLPQFGGATRTTEHFRIWGVFGDGFVGGDDGNATSETFTDVIASVVEEVYAAETALFGRVPLSDAVEPCNGGDGRIDIYLSPIDMAGRTQAHTVAYPNRCEKVPGYIVVNPIAMALSLGRATVSHPMARNKREWKSVIAHEFLHLLQLGMDRQAACADYEWFDEATATWVIDHVDPQGNFEDGGGVPGANGFARRQGRFYMNYLYNDHRVSIENASPESNPALNGYGDYLFFQFLARNYQPETIQQIFDATVGQASVEAFASVLQSRGGLKAVWPAFAQTLWNDPAGVLDYWSTVDAYDIGLAGLYSPAPGQIGASDKLKSRAIDQQGGPRANFPLLANALVGEYFEIQPRSLFFEHLKFTDASVHSIYFFNPIAALPGREFMKLQVKKKIGGQWQAVEDWTAEPYKQFCRDKTDERLEEVLLIVSNSEADRGQEQPFRIPKNVPMSVSTSNVGCWMWQGSAQTTVIGGSPAVVDLEARAANVSLTVQSVLPGRLVFTSESGTVSARSTVTAGSCVTTAVGAGRPVVPGADDGILDFGLDLDLGFGQIGGDPPERKMIQLSGSSVLSTTTSMVCPQVNQTSVGQQSWEWLHVDDPALYTVSADGQVIEGRFTAVLPDGSTLDSQWRFTAVRQ